MTSVRQTTTTTYTSSGAHPSLMDNGSPMDGSLDLLLEDLQSSVSRPGSSLGNLTNGHVTTTTTTTRRQQQQQQQQLQNQNYPSQHFHHSSSSSSNAPSQQHHNGGVQYLQPMNSTTVVSERASSPGQTLTSSYKTYQYQYTSSSADGTPGGQSSGHEQVYGAPLRQVAPPPAGRQRSMSPQREMPVVPDTRMRQNLNELDSLLVDLHHAQQSTPLEPPTAPHLHNESSTQSVSRTVRTYQQQQQDNHTYGTPNTVRRELYPSSPKPERSSSLTRRVPGHIRAPSPTRQVTTTVKTYTYEVPANTNVNIKPVVGTPIVNQYSYELPVDQAVPDDTVITYKYAGLPKGRALEPPKEPATLVDPPPNSYSYHYSYSSNNNQIEPPHKPFPSPAMTPPPSAEPPKHLDELMASFTDTVDTSDMHNEHPVPAAPLQEYMTESPLMAPPSPVRQRKIQPEKPAPVVHSDRMMSKNVAGPPVYYPPGVDMFTKKDEPVHAKMKEGASSSESKSSGGGVAAVPVCLPVCCAMPCVIM